jgi:hypothetical protein
LSQENIAKRVIDEAATIKITPHILDAYAMAAMPARYAVERRLWGEAAALTQPQQRDFAWDRFPHAEAALVFARALGAARNAPTWSRRIARVNGKSTGSQKSETIVRW